MSEGMRLGECWGGLRGPLSDYFSFSQIKEIAGAAGLPVQRLGHLQQRQGPGGASKGQLIDNLDLLFAEKSPDDQDRIAAATIREMFRPAQQPQHRRAMEEQMSAALAAHGWGLRDGEACPLPPPGPGSVSVIRSDPRAAFAAATGVNEITPDAAQPPRGPGSVGRNVTVGGQLYRITGLGWGTRPTWDFIHKDGAPLGRERFLSLPPADRQELFNHVEAYANSELAGRLRIDPVGVPGRPAAGVTRGGALGSGAFNSSPFNSTLFNAPGRSGAVGGAPVNTDPINGGPPSGNAGSPILDNDGNPILDSDGNPILDSDGNPILDNGSAVASGSMGGPIRVTPMEGRAVAGPPSGPPPAVPEPGPALIEPEWVGDRLTLPKRVAANDLWDGGVAALIAAVRTSFEEFIGALAQSGTNFHPAARRAIEGIPELLTGVPDQARVFRMGHAVEHLEALQSAADEELPNALSVQYRTLVGQFRRLVERFPEWRALTLKAQGEPLTEEQAREAVPVARELATALSTEAAAEVADKDIGDALVGLTDAAEAATGAERVLLDFDLVASISQIMTTLMRPVAECWAYSWREYGAGMAEELKKLPREAGAGTVKWGKRTLLKIAAMAPTTAWAAHLGAIYPNLSWLPAMVALLIFIAPAPKD